MTKKTKQVVGNKVPVNAGSLYQAILNLIQETGSGT